MSKVNAVQVYHSGAGEYSDFIPGETTLSFAYEYAAKDGHLDEWTADHEADPKSYLGMVYRYNNAGTGDPSFEPHVYYEQRSLSVSDACVLPNGEVWVVNGMGWSQISPIELYDACQRTVLVGKRVQHKTQTGITGTVVSVHLGEAVVLDDDLVGDPEGDTLIFNTLELRVLKEEEGAVQ
mgnify:FL=1